ncbi:sushi, von Willebrand factor type A, EGF and pentraxin domain-containing protein 1-like isoform X2 [Dreissena polymorpha]|uniref:sushi, von Willebrand factor type A, EGF and pentraxin domain-containing protein 1-like isoform X2 n=1 Tax=Dreissena polymorpha TaxID=45954 RepID=UPI0022649218|nr:sushi, von Willebrand factor type A, EGF and pentraxin domain-containing protein 1-like isoform X2 [Dreissena polymorpha]
MLAFFVAIYIGVCCSATPNAENEGCPDLNNHTNWETIGPNIHHINMTGQTYVYCKPGYQGHLNPPDIYTDHFRITCKHGTWDVRGIFCQKKDVTCPVPNNNSNDSIWQHTQPFNYTKTTTRYVVKCEPGYDDGEQGSNGYRNTIVATCDNDTWTVNAKCREIECGNPNNYTNWQNSVAAERTHPIDYNETTHNSSAIVQCLSGDAVYSDDGQRTRHNFNIVCKENHKWQADGKCGCRWLTMKSNWDDIGPNIDTIRQLSSPDIATAVCKMGYNAYNPQYGETLDNYNLTCVNGSWKNNSVCQEIDCHSPQVLQNGHYIISKTTYNSTATYACNSGYEIHGKISVTCLKIGKWEMLEANCILKDCGTPPALTNGDRTFHKTTVNSTVEYTCNPGYNAHGVSNIICPETGSWSKLEIECILKDCNSPPVLQYGQSMVSKTTFNSIVTYTCKDGYELHGMNSITCLENGKWEILEANCTIKDCKSPPVLLNGHHIVSKTTFNSTVTYTCDVGFVIHGKNSTTCLKNGKWEILEANCTIKDCHSPPILDNGHTTVARTTYNSTAIYACYFGYDIKGPNSITCLETGAWDKLEANCTIKDCQYPPVLQNGFLDATTTTYNSSAIYSCNPGYIMFGENFTTCLDTGNWSKLLANCTIKDCGTPPSLTNGDRTFHNTTVNSTAEYTCNPGYYINGMSTISCRDTGIWDALAANCTIKNCHSPPDLRNGYSTVSTTTYNSTAIYTCSSGYDMHGPNSIRCLATGDWDKLQAKCNIKDCQNPPVLQNGFHNATSTRYNSTAIYSCNPGYRLFGGNSITCLDTGNWSKLLVKCTIKDCQNPPVLQNGFHNATSTTYNSNAIYTCNPGYRLFGESSITCLDTGNWSKLLVNCVIMDCGTPAMLANGDRTYLNTTVNSTTEYICNTGYDLIGKGNINCNETGTWSILEANCTLIDCNSPPVLTNGFATVSTTTYNSIAIYTCSSGYDLHGPYSIACLATGDWDKLDAKCTIKDCGTPPLLTNGAGTFINTTVNNTAMYTCNPGYDFVGMRNIRCLENGTWRALEAQCTNKDCQNPPVLHNGFHNATSTKYNSTVIYSCNPGYIMFGENSITCLDTGNWSELLVNCTIKDCQNPPLLQDGFHAATTTTYNSTVIYSCNPGYIMFGESSITCLDTGNWSKLLVNCTIKDCGTPPMLTNGDRTFLNTTVNSTIEYTCNPGYDLIGIGNIHCIETGTWSLLKANCTMKDCHSPPVLKNGFVTVSTTTFNSSSIYTCFSSYDMHGPNSIACLATGDWDKLNANCTVKDCGTPPLLTNGARTFINTTVNNTVTYTCNPGYDYVGMRNIRCLENGTWRALEAQCTFKDCQNPPALQNGFHAAATTTYNSTVMYSCNPGYTMFGENSITCLDTGNWSELLVNCTIKDCQNPPVLQDGFHVAITTTYNSTVIYSCNPGYRMFGENSITCLDTEDWSELLVNCTIKDCGNTFMENGECNATSTYFKSSATCSCHRGYHFTGINTSIECLANGTWSLVHGNCAINDCGQPPIGNLSTIHAPQTTFNATAVYACLSGYSTTNITELTCTAKGEWDGTAPICSDIDECLNRPKPCDFNAKCTNSDGSFKCECQTGYRDLDGFGGQHCADVNECAFDGDFYCMHALNQTRVCVNTDGGYVCVCNKGLTGSKCEIDIIECNDTTTCGSHAICTNTYGGYSCACPDGYPQGNPYLGCFEPVLLDFKAAGDRYNGDNPMIDAYHISTRLPYLGEYINWFKPSMNGFISLDFQPLYNEYGGENASEWKAAVQNHRVIAPLWTNIDSSNISDGGLWIHSFTDKQPNKTDLAKIQDLIRQYTNLTEFNVSVALVATWKHVTVHSPYEPGYELVKHQNLSMQCIFASDGMYTYIMFNYDREQFSIRPLPEVPVASGFTNLNYTGIVLSDRQNFTLLNQGSNVKPGFAGRWIYNVTVVTEAMKNEILCQRFYEDNMNDLKPWIQTQLEFALPCPCQEVLMMEDYTFTRNDSLRPGFGSHMTCYESWFFSAYGIKQRCCYMFSKLQTQYPGAVAAEFENDTAAKLLEKGYNQCCSSGGNQKFCHLYQVINPPDDCSRYTISDEIPTDEGIMQAIIKRVTKMLGI